MSKDPFICISVCPANASVMISRSINGRPTTSMKRRDKTFARLGREQYHPSYVASEIDRVTQIGFSRDAGRSIDRLDRTAPWATALAGMFISKTSGFLNPKVQSKLDP